jgi:hypothetical protein
VIFARIAMRDVIHPAVETYKGEAGSIGKPTSSWLLRVPASNRTGKFVLRRTVF